jgi:hypothetical protein
VSNPPNYKLEYSTSIGIGSALSGKHSTFNSIAVSSYIDKKMLRTIGTATRKSSIGTAKVPLPAKGRIYNSGLHMSLYSCFFLLFTGMSATAIITYIWANKVAARKLLALVLDPSHPKSEFSTAYTESFGFFDDIPNNSWKLMKERVRNRQNHLDPEQHWSQTFLPFRWYQDNVSLVFLILPNVINSAMKITNVMINCHSGILVKLRNA